MPDQDCIDACKAAYGAAVQTCNTVLAENLLLAKTEADRQEAKEAFSRCMADAKERKDLCLGECG